MEFIIGLVIGAIFMNKLSSLKGGFSFRIWGYDVNVTKTNPNESENVVELTPQTNNPKKDEKKPSKSEGLVKTGGCSFCGDEDIFVAGTSSIMECPICKKNRKKAKKEASGS